MTARLVACPPVRWKISFAIMVRGLSSESRLARGRMFALRSVLRVYGVGVEWSLVFTQGFAGSLPTSIGRGLTAAAPDGGLAANGLFAVLRAVAAGEPQALGGRGSRAVINGESRFEALADWNYVGIPFDIASDCAPVDVLSACTGTVARRLLAVGWLWSRGGNRWRQDEHVSGDFNQLRAMVDCATVGWRRQERTGIQQTRCRHSSHSRLIIGCASDAPGSFYFQRESAVCQRSTQELHRDVGEHAFGKLCSVLANVCRAVCAVSALSHRLGSCRPKISPSSDCINSA